MLLIVLNVILLLKIRLKGELILVQKTKVVVSNITYNLVIIFILFNQNNHHFISQYGGLKGGGFNNPSL